MKADVSTETTLVPQAVVSELTRQITLERSSSAFYVLMSSVLDNMNWPGFSKWCWNAAHDDRKDADKILKYLSMRHTQVAIEAVPQPPDPPRDLLQMFSMALEHEKAVTASVNSISQLALTSGDHATYHFLRKYIKSQLKEESSVQDVVAQLVIAGDNSSALLHVDHRIKRL